MVQRQRRTCTWPRAIPKRLLPPWPPVLAGEAFALHVNMRIEAALLDALGRTAMEEPKRAESSVELALALAEPQGQFMIFLTVPGCHELLAAHPGTGRRTPPT